MFDPNVTYSTIESSTIYATPSNVRVDKSYAEYEKQVKIYLENEIGPKTHTLWFAVPVTVLYTAILVAGIVGNALVCIVIARNSSLHTATNYYLFNLAVSDLIYLLFGLPNEVILFWHQYPYPFGAAFCSLSRLIKDACTFVSVLTIVAFSMERLLAICYPLRVYMMSGFKRAVRIIAAIWVVSILCGAPFGLYTRIEYLRFPVGSQAILKQSALCRMRDDTPIPVWELSAIIFYVIPTILLVAFYSRMAIEIHRQSKHGHALGVRHSSSSSQSNRSKSRRTVVKMLVVVVITFFVCWSPYHIQHLLVPYLKEAEAVLLNTVLFIVSGLFYYTSCTINPIIYNVMSRRYRNAFRETVCGKKKHQLRHANGFGRNEQRSIRTNVETIEAENNNHLMRTRSQRRSSSTYSKTTVLNENGLQPNV